MDNSSISDSISRLNKILGEKKTGTIVIPSNPSPDAIASATSLYLALIKHGKTVSIACSTKIEADLIGSEKIQTNLVNYGDSLVVAFPYSDGSIDKIDYHIKDNQFELIITPREGFPRLDPKKVSFSYTGNSVDFIIVLDTPNLNMLGSLYLNNQNLFQGVDIINIDRHLTNNNFGTINIVQKNSSSLSEIIFQILKNLSFEIDKDIATNLYYGLTAATNNFSSYSVNAQTFETAAELLKLGAVKKSLKKSQSSLEFSFKPKIELPKKFNQTKSINFEQKPIENIEKEPKSAQSQETPQDWLKPKIFKSSSGLI